MSLHLLWLPCSVFVVDLCCAGISISGSRVVFHSRIPGQGAGHKPQQIPADNLPGGEVWEHHWSCLCPEEGGRDAPEAFCSHGSNGTAQGQSQSLIIHLTDFTIFCISSLPPSFFPFLPLSLLLSLSLFLIVCVRSTRAVPRRRWINVHIIFSVLWLNSHQSRW